MTIAHANRGLAAEAEIILANEYYRREGIAVVEKQPTEWLPLRGPDGQIRSAKVTHQASVDFIGVAHGFGALAFDVKSCSQARWPLSSLKAHQYEFLRDWHDCGGISFILLYHSLVGWRLLKWQAYEAVMLDGIRSLTVNLITTLPACKGIEGCPVDYLSTLKLVI